MYKVSEQDFKQFADYVKAHYGIHFKKEKKTLVEGRLRSVLAGKNFRSLSDYLEYVKADKTGKAATEMLNRITTNHTFFMREPAHFHYFKETVLPYLVNTMRYKDLRIWSAACSTGEEPYTLAMIITDFLGTKKQGTTRKYWPRTSPKRFLTSPKPAFTPMTEWEMFPQPGRSGTSQKTATATMC